MNTKVKLPVIDTDEVSERYRLAAIDPAERRLLITDFRGTEQVTDLTEPPNCDGLGRIRHFRQMTTPGWPRNSLPIEPACKFLGQKTPAHLRAQVFQNAVCNWRCWYCYVPFNLLAANRHHSRWVTAGELVDLYSKEPERPFVMDLSGGQPDLIPEWIPWTMRALRDRGLEGKVYLWSDDNLSNDYFWRHLSGPDRELVASYSGYGRVGCFKGFDSKSFSFNTAAAPDLFARQFDLFSRLIAVGVDMYGYVTLTSPRYTNTADAVARFVDRLQAVAENLPLRIVPLEVQVFSPVRARLDATRHEALIVQRDVVQMWLRELERRFSAPERNRPIVDVALHLRGQNNAR